MSEPAHTLVEIRDSPGALERRIDTRFDQLERRFDDLDDKLSRHFRWLVGIQVTTLVAIVGALFARA